MKKEDGRWTPVEPNEKPNVIILKYGGNDFMFDRIDGKGLHVGASGEAVVRCLRTEEGSCRPTPEELSCETGVDLDAINLPCKKRPGA